MGLAAVLSLCLLTEYKVVLKLFAKTFSLLACDANLPLLTPCYPNDQNNKDTHINSPQAEHRFDTFIALLFGNISAPRLAGQSGQTNGNRQGVFSRFGEAKREIIILTDVDDHLHYNFLMMIIDFKQAR